MEVYFTLICNNRREFLDPGKVHEGGNKFSPCVQGKTANLLAFLVMGLWMNQPIQFLPDTGEPLPDDYRDITEETIRDYNEAFRSAEPIAFNPNG